MNKRRGYFIEALRFIALACLSYIVGLTVYALCFYATYRLLFRADNLVPFVGVAFHDSLSTQFPFLLILPLILAPVLNSIHRWLRGYRPVFPYMIAGGLISIMCCLLSLWVHVRRDEMWGEPLSIFWLVKLVMYVVVGTVFGFGFAWPRPAENRKRSVE
jgi:hypothetical protein